MKILCYGLAILNVLEAGLFIAGVYEPSATIIAGNSLLIALSLYTYGREAE